MVWTWEAWRKARETGLQADWQIERGDGKRWDEVPAISQASGPMAELRQQT